MPSAGLPSALLLQPRVGLVLALLTLYLPAQFNNAGISGEVTRFEENEPSAEKLSEKLLAEQTFDGWTEVFKTNVSSSASHLDMISQSPLPLTSACPRRSLLHDRRLPAAPRQVHQCVPLSRSLLEKWLTCGGVYHRRRRPCRPRHLRELPECRDQHDVHLGADQARTEPLCLRTFYAPCMPAPQS